jgi:hypothetical protein
VVFRVKSSIGDIHRIVIDESDEEVETQRAGEHP